MSIAAVENGFAEVKALAREAYGIARARGAQAACRQLQGAAAELTRATRIAVAGERSRGKSTLINALLGRRVLPVDVDVTTNVYLELVPAKGAPEHAVVHFRDGSERPVELSELDAYATEAGNAGNALEVAHVTVALSSPLVAEGMQLLDTPGVGGLAGAHGAAAANAVAQADALLMVLDARAPATDAELEFLAGATPRAGRLVIAETWADRSRDPGAIVAEDRAAIERRLPELAAAPIVTVSAALALEAVGEPDPEEAALLAQESNVGALADELRTRALAPTIAERSRAMAAQALLVLDDLERPDRALVAAVGPGGDAAAALARARSGFEALRARPAKRELERRLAGVLKEVDGRLRAGLADLRDRFQDEIELAEKLPTGAELEERWQLEVQRIWNELCGAMDARAQEAIEAVCAELRLDVDAAGALAGVAMELPEPAATRAERGANKREERDKWLKRAVRGGSPAVLAIVTLNPAYLVIGVGMVLGHESLQSKAAEQRELARFLERSVRRATPQLATLLAERFAAVQRAALERVDPIYGARLESLAAAAELLARPGADPAQAQARLAEIAALRERLRAIEELGG